MTNLIADFKICLGMKQQQLSRRLLEQSRQLSCCCAVCLSLAFQLSLEKLISLLQLMKAKALHAPSPPPLPAPTALHPAFHLHPNHSQSFSPNLFPHSLTFYLNLYWVMSHPKNDLPYNFLAAGITFDVTDISRHCVSCNPYVSRYVWSQRWSSSNNTSNTCRCFLKHVISASRSNTHQDT